MRGNTEPRLWTPPLRDLEDPASTYGHAVIRFADKVLKTPLDPWQCWTVVHAGELTEDGIPRFRQILILVSRQNGKTHLLRVLSNFWLFVQKHELTMGVANKLTMSKESWRAALNMARAVPALDKQIKKVREANAQEEILTESGARYRIDAAGKNAGRGFTINRIIWDEVRQEEDWETHSSLAPTMAAVRDAQMFMISNMGTVDSVVLNDARAAGLAGTDPTLGLIEYSAPKEADPQDPDAWAAANPNLGLRVLVSDIASHAAKAVVTGGEALTRFKTERLCQMVQLKDPAIDPDAWTRCLEKGDLSEVKDRAVLVVDVAPDQRHATLVAAAVLADGRVRVEPVTATDGPGAAEKMWHKLKPFVEKVRPRMLGWLPTGPAGSLADHIRPRKGRSDWPPPGVVVQEVTGEVSAVCMAFAKAVSAGQIVHSGDPLLDAHVKSAERLTTHSGTWVFSRKNGHCDAAYAAAAAAFLARTMPIASGKPRIHFYGIPD